MFSLTNVAKKRVFLVLTLSLLMVAAWPVAAADIYLDYTCTLKDAINAANKDSQEKDCEAGSGDDTIILTRDDKPRSGEQPVIREDLVIKGRNHTINAERGDPVFIVEDAHLTIRNLKIKFDGLRGTAFKVRNGKLTLINVIVENCKRGVEQKNSHTTIRGRTEICDLEAHEMVTGTGTTKFGLAPLPAPETCGALPGASGTVSATYGLQSGVQCRQVDGGGIGVQSIVDAGFISAVDVWGYAEQGVEICFPQLGSVTFLDAATSPRTVTSIDSYSRGNSTCVHLTRAGTVVLMPGAPTGVAAADPVAEPVTTTSAVDGCGVHAIGHLKFFTDPASDAEIIGYITRGTTVTFVSRRTGWYQVSHGGQTGWVGGKYATRNAGC